MQDQKTNARTLASASLRALSRVLSGNLVLDCWWCLLLGTVHVWCILGLKVSPAHAGISAQQLPHATLQLWEAKPLLAAYAKDQVRVVASL